MQKTSLGYQINLISTYKKLVDSSKVSFGTLSKLERIIPHLISTSNATQVFSNIISSSNELLENFDNLAFKLEQQNSKHHQKKETMLKNIKLKMLSVAKRIDHEKCRNQLEKNEKLLIALSNDEDRLSKSISRLKHKLNKRRNRLNEVNHQKSSDSTEDLRDKYNQRVERNSRMIEELEESFQKDFVKPYLASVAQEKRYEHQVKNISESAFHPSVVRYETALALDGTIYDYEDKGFGKKSWGYYIRSKEYAIKRFGHTIEYGSKIWKENRIPCTSGQEWMEIIGKFLDAKKHSAEYKRLMDNEKKSMDNVIFNIEKNSATPEEKIISLKIDKLTKKIHSLENDLSAESDSLNDVQKRVQQVITQIKATKREMERLSA